MASVKRHRQLASSSSPQSTEHKGTVRRGHIWRRPFQTAQPARAPGSRAPARLDAIRSSRSMNRLCARRPFLNRSRSWHGRPCWSAKISTSASSIRLSTPRRWASSCCRRCRRWRWLPPSGNRGPRPKRKKSEPRNRRRGAPRGRSAPRNRRRNAPREKRDRERSGARPRFAQGNSGRCFSKKARGGRVVTF